MSIWAISDGCTIDENSIEHNVIRDGRPIHMRKQCWDLLIALLDAKKHGWILSFDAIGEVLWPNGGGWDDARKETLKKVLDPIKKAIGPDSISNTYGVGYYLTYNIKELPVPHIGKNEYYEKIWKNHFKGTVRDHVATGNVRELIDFFVLPSITTSTGELVDTPFSGKNFSKFFSRKKSLYYHVQIRGKTPF